MKATKDNPSSMSCAKECQAPAPPLGSNLYLKEVSNDCDPISNGSFNRA